MERKMKYEEADMEIVMFVAEDVITSSQLTGEGPGIGIEIPWENL